MVPPTAGYGKILTSRKRARRIRFATGRMPNAKLLSSDAAGAPEPSVPSFQLRDRPQAAQPPPPPKQRIALTAEDGSTTDFSVLETLESVAERAAKAKKQTRPPPETPMEAHKAIVLELGVDLGVKKTPSPAPPPAAEKLGGEAEDGSRIDLSVVESFDDVRRRSEEKKPAQPPPSPKQAKTSAPPPAPAKEKLECDDGETELSVLAVEDAEAEGGFRNLASEPPQEARSSAPLPPPEQKPREVEPPDPNECDEIIQELLRDFMPPTAEATAEEEELDDSELEEVLGDEGSRPPPVPGVKAPEEEPEPELDIEVDMDEDLVAEEEPIEAEEPEDAEAEPEPEAEEPEGESGSEPPRVPQAPAGDEVPEATSESEEDGPEEAAAQPEAEARAPATGFPIGDARRSNEPFEGGIDNAEVELEMLRDSERLDNILDSTLVELALAGDMEGVEHLVLEQGANPNAVDEATGSTVLMLVASVGAHETVEFLLGKGARANDKDEQGWTALMYAASTNKDTVAALLDAGADAGYKTPDGQDAATRALLSGKEDIGELILEYIPKSGVDGAKGTAHQVESIEVKVYGSGLPVTVNFDNPEVLTIGRDLSCQ
ncbi:TPA: hypothetical protein EYP38_03100, partial [Candidatus Micrarchaeota archaeon]|nr:hypothetical protein [Candidatus Micrarchaeota archaeon]